MTRNFSLLCKDGNSSSKEVLNFALEDDGTGVMKIDGSVLKPFGYEELSKILRAAAEEVDKHKND